ncbi:3'.5'-bisphosphate nucleotidase [Entamoeba marina]
MAYSKELQLALEIVQKSCLIAQSVAESTLTDQTVIKKDRSPVTVGDYSIQAYVNNTLSTHYPNDKIVAEEDTKQLPEDILTKVCHHVAKFTTMTKEDVLSSIDKGTAEGGNGRYWVLDPIDGTLGFLRREQYAVCLGFMVDGELMVGVLGCPNYDGQGVRRYKVSDIVNGEQVTVSTISNSAELCFCESVEVSHSDHDRSEAIGKALKVTKEPVRMDSQCKYMAVATGKADVYLRLPRDMKYVEKIWDHAAGYLIVKEAGGNVTDIFGKDLDFKLGRGLSSNHGIIATNGLLHEQVVTAVKDAFKDFI